MANTYATTAGTKLFYGDVGGGDPTTQLAGIDDITLPTHEADEFEVTRLDQEVSAGVHDWWKQWAPDHIDPGQIELKLAMDGTTVETLYGLVRQLKSWKILYSNGDKIVCDGWIKSVGQEAQRGDEVLIPVTIRLSGKPVYTKASAG
ncbi:MAG TPA: phage tail tube protein [Phycisphaeraceae bacterium]